MKQELGKTWRKGIEVRGCFSRFVCTQVSGDKDVFLCWVHRGHLFHEKFYGLFLGIKGEVREPFSSFFPVPSAQNNQYAKAAYFGLRVRPLQAHGWPYESHVCLLTLLVSHLPIDQGKDGGVNRNAEKWFEDINCFLPPSLSSSPHLILSGKEDLSCTRSKVLHYLGSQKGKKGDNNCIST